MKLIIINGTTGVGKSTVAKRLHNELPMTFLVDMDSQRRFISGYRETPKESSELSFVVSMAIIEACLKEGRDVIIDKMIWSINDYLDRLVSLGKKYKADTYEFILSASKKTVMERLDKRGYKPEGLLTPEKAELFWEETQKLTNHRDGAILIDTEKLNADEVFEKIKNQIFN